MEPTSNKPDAPQQGAGKGSPTPTCSAYLCLACRVSYEIPAGEGIRCPECGSKDRESLEVTDSDILDMLLAAGAIRCDLLDAPGLVEPTRESLAEEFRRRMIYTASVVEPNAAVLARGDNAPPRESQPQ